MPWLHQSVVDHWISTQPPKKFWRMPWFMMVWLAAFMNLRKLLTSKFETWLGSTWFVLFHKFSGVKLCCVCWLITAVNPCTRSLSLLSAKSTTSRWWRWTTTRNLVNGLVFAKLTKKARPVRLSAARVLSSKIGAWRRRPQISFSTTWRSSNCMRLLNQRRWMCNIAQCNVIVLCCP